MSGFVDNTRTKPSLWTNDQIQTSSFSLTAESDLVCLLPSPQARDEVITVLKADKLDVALLEAKYGFVTPQKVLQALQRDAIQDKADVLQEDIYERPMEEVTPTLS